MKRGYIAVDPGKKGAIAYGTTLTDVQMMNTGETPQQVLDQMFHIKGKQPRPWTIWMERNTGFMAGIKRKGEDGTDEEGGVSPKSMYSFGIVTGRIEMALLAIFHTPVRPATPLKWMNALGIITGQKRFMTTSQWKNILKQEAIERFDGILLPKQITLANCDALLIYYAAVTGRLR